MHGIFLIINGVRAVKNRCGTNHAPIDGIGGVVDGEQKLVKVMIMFQGEGRGKTLDIQRLTASDTWELTHA